MRRFVPLLSFGIALTLAGCGGVASNPGNTTSGTGTTNTGTGSGSGGGGSAVSNVAYVYVTNTVGNANEITGYAAAKDGSLTALPGSPYQTNGDWLAVNGKYLFTNVQPTDIRSFTINSDGSITQVSTVNAEAKNNPPNDGGPISLFLDKSGQTLYDGDIYADGANNGYQFWSVQTSGALGYVGLTQNLSPSYGQPLSFTPDNKYAYGASCVKFTPQIFGYQRNVDGSLTQLNINPPFPDSPVAGTGYCPYLTAVSNDFHLFTTLTPENFGPQGPTQIGVYSINADGSLSTTSTAANMATTVLKTVRDLKLDPTSAFLAVAGQGGLQLFATHGSSPVTPIASPLTIEVDQMFWDNAGHLYAISTPGNAVYVFNVSASGAVPVSGSPYTLQNPVHLTVQPLT